MLISDPDNLKEALRLAYVEIEGLRAHLKNIAAQKTTEELKAEGDQEYEDADFEGGYDALIHIARRADESAAKTDAFDSKKPE